jgi:protein-disulfide isomerase
MSSWSTGAARRGERELELAVALGAAVALVAGGGAACATRPAPTAAAPTPTVATPTTPAPAADAPAAPRTAIDIREIVYDSLKRIAVPADGPSRGSRAAKVTIVEFSDFECPFCARVQATLQRLLREHPDDVRIVFRHLPLAFHAHAALAAEAAVAADEQGKFWEMHDRLFDDQIALERAGLERSASALGLDLPRFRAALDSHRGKATVDADVALAGRLHVRGTPNFFINGRHVMGAQPYEEFARIVDDEIARADGLLARGVPAADLYATFVAHADPSLPEVKPPLPAPGTDVYAMPAGDAPARGATRPKVTIVEFAEFQCPFCARVSATLERLLADYRGDVQVVYRHNPLSFHLQAMDAALAAEAAREQGKFWEMHDMLFAHQSSLGPEDLERYARDVGLDMAAFRRSLKGRSGRPRIRRDMDLAAQFGAIGTPYFFVNGRILRGAQPIEAWKPLIDEEIRKADARLAAGTPRAGLYSALTTGGLTRIKQTSADPAERDPGKRHRVDVVGAPSRGAGADALVTIVEFGDLQCPFTRRVEETLARLLRAHKGKVRLVWRDLPLSTLHSGATAAAAAARAADGQGKFWQMHDRLLANQEQLDGIDLERHAEALRLDMPKFREAMAAPANRGPMNADLNAAMQLGLRGTPSFFINGRYLGGALPFEAFEKVIAEELRVAEAMIARGTPRTRIYAALMEEADAAPLQPAALPSP